MDKIKWVFINIVNFVVIALLIFLPLFTLSNPNGSLVFETKTMYGFNFLGGLMIKSDGNNSQVLASKILGFVPVMMILSSFVIDKITNVKIGKDIVNFLCLFVSFIYVFLLPIISSEFITETYRGYVEFNKIWGYYVITIITGLVMAYYLAALIISLVKINKENKEVKE